MPVATDTIKLTIEENPVEEAEAKESSTGSTIKESLDILDPNSIFHRIKVRSISNKKCQRFLPVGVRSGWFGMHTVPRDATHLVITEGEFDAMSVFQATGLPSISLPNGCTSLPVELLPEIERFTRIYLWMDSIL